MCNNFQLIKSYLADWLMHNFNCALPNTEWQPEAYPTYPEPFIYLDNGKKL